MRSPARRRAAFTACQLPRPDAGWEKWACTRISGSPPERGRASPRGGGGSTPPPPCPTARPPCGERGGACQAGVPPGRGGRPRPVGGGGSLHRLDHPDQGGARRPLDREQGAVVVGERGEVVGATLEQHA